MSSKKKITIKEDLLSLVAQIDTADITDIDIYWEALGYSLLQILKDFDKRADVDATNIEIIIEQLVDKAELSDFTNLINTTKELKEICMRGSTSEIDEDDLSTLFSEVKKFEKGFEKLLNELDE